MTTTAEKIKNENGVQVKEAKPRVYKITPDSFASQVKDMDHKDLFLIQKTIDTELAKRKADAEALVKELGGKV